MYSAPLQKLWRNGLSNDKEYLLLLGLSRRLDAVIKQKGSVSAFVNDICEQIQFLLSRYEYLSGDYKRKGEWIPTPNGHRFWLEDPRPCEVDIEDIAYILSRIPRFNGATSGPVYSVAQHSIHVSEVVPEWAALPALLHDAHEAYIGDHTTPVKRAIKSNLEEVEGRIITAIADKFDFEWSDECAREVKRADDIMLATEIRDLTPYGTTYSSCRQLPLVGMSITPWREDEVIELFINRYVELSGDEDYV
jgi:5'-deoxynucleotidase YfbR-like HD superfamily hydrolase